jgi:Flp pilus assembly CpaE family ATPase
VLDLGFCLEEDEELLYDQVRFRRNAVSRLALERADLVVAVLRADPVGIHDFIRAYQQLRDLRVEGDRIHVVVNQLRPGLMGAGTTDQIRAALERYVGPHRVWFIGYDRGGMDAALMAGQAVGEARPGSAIHRELATLAADLLGREATGRPSPSRRRRRLRSAR